ncbi:MAG: hypothetical protein Q8916_01755 [Bacteroidota bacterium]|nr:hypothetical protein [Bacteroidota bacterium]MDP4229112.1 hypothetical protein [Bacteroidota bacterium]MDP4236792.1 hypothetical protein [Bacteroidota bacterium]
MAYLITLLLSISISGAGTHGPASAMRDSTSTKVRKHKMTITEVLKKYTDKWMEIPGVTGTGEGKSHGKPCIMVFIERRTATIEKKIPKTVEGYKVVLEESGKIEAR